MQPKLFKNIADLEQQLKDAKSVRELCQTYQGKRQYNELICDLQNNLDFAEEFGRPIDGNFYGH